MRQLALPGKQRGVVMFVALIMMVVMLLVAVASFNMGRQNTIIAGNMQHRAEVVSAANQTVERVLSTTTFLTTPNTPLANSGVPPTDEANYDVNGDGTDDITVTFNPAPCIKKAQAIKNADLNPLNPNDTVCLTGAGQTMGVEGSATGDSLCANTIWEVKAVATDSVTGAAATVVAGVAVRVSQDDAITPANVCD